MVGAKLIVVDAEKKIIFEFPSVSFRTILTSSIFRISPFVEFCPPPTRAILRLWGMPVWSSVGLFVLAGLSPSG